MAGAFGYEKDKYDVSIACGERSLLPEVRKAGLSTLIVADGFSCKEQIAQETNRHAVHLAEVLRFGYRNGGQEVPTMYPESHSVEHRKRAQRKSMARAAAFTALAVGALVLTFLKRRQH
jgi:hypothetical protein